MHAALLTMVLFVGADQTPPPGMVLPPTVQQPVAVTAPEFTGSAVGGDGRMGAPPYRYAPPRDPQETDGWLSSYINYVRAFGAPMPQTCYSPHFGCYPGNGRDIYRYPAFHGYYYRQAYNYRPLFEYPWQANPHEPVPLELRQGILEARLVNETMTPTTAPETVPAPPQPTKMVHMGLQ